MEHACFLQKCRQASYKRFHQYRSTSLLSTFAGSLSTSTSSTSICVLINCFVENVLLFSNLDTECGREQLLQSLVELVLCQTYYLVSDFTNFHITSRIICWFNSCKISLLTFANGIASFKPEMPTRDHALQKNTTIRHHWSRLLIVMAATSVHLPA